MLISSSVRLLECLAEVEFKKERPECCMGHSRGYRVTLDDRGTCGRRED